jgi:hypothetical protein
LNPARPQQTLGDLGPLQPVFHAETGSLQALFCDRTLLDPNSRPQVLPLFDSHPIIAEEAPMHQADAE